MNFTAATNRANVPAAVMFTVKMEDRQYMYVASDGGRLEVQAYR